MTSIVAIAKIGVLRLLRERSNLFFVFVFPMLLILLIGLSFGSSGGARMLVVGDAQDPSVNAVIEALQARDGIQASLTRTRDVALDSLSRGRVAGVIVLADGFGDRLHDGTAQDVEVALRDEAAGSRPAIGAAMAQVAAPYQAAELALAFGVSESGADALRTAGVTGAIDVKTRTVGDGLEAEFAGLSQFSLGASTQLILFVFITTLNGATRVVESRELGATRRMLSTPTTVSQVVAGEGLGRFAVALFQAAWVIVGGLLLFSVDWGDPFAALVVVAAFGLASASAALLLGAVASSVSQAGGLGTLLGLTMAALGGCMAPLDIFSDGLRKVAHITPHAWANDAFAELTRRDGNVLDVLPEIAVLLAFAVVLGVLAVWRLRVTITES